MCGESNVALQPTYSEAFIMPRNIYAEDRRLEQQIKPLKTSSDKGKGHLMNNVYKEKQVAKLKGIRYSESGKSEDKNCITANPNDLKEGDDE